MNAEEKMKAIRVNFEENAKHYYFDPNNISLKDGDIVIVNTEGCRDNGRVVGEIFELDEKKFDKELKKVVKKANQFDLKTIEENAEKEIALFNIFKEKAAEFKLNLKPLKASLSFDERKIIFFYYAARKVDFRELLKALLRVIKKKIELRQVDAREEVKIIGGVGLCGQRCCCILFLTRKSPMSIRMAKTQGLSLNPEQISGICGKLMCCLKFENDTYIKQAKGMPTRDSIVHINNEAMIIIESNVLIEEIKLVKILDQKDEDGNNLLSDEIQVLTKKEYLEKIAENDKRKETH